MNRHWLSRKGTPDLILIFGGWGLGPGPFKGIAGAGDVLFVDGYTRLDDPQLELAQYDHVDLIAFSFGVASAAHWMHMKEFQARRRVAVSGTLTPADPDRGIAPETIRATAEQLTAESFAKFCRRAGLGGTAPEIDIAAARQELYAVIERGPAPDPGFDRIWIPQRDRIIPTKAQEAAWAEHGQAVRAIPGPHIPFHSGQNWAEWLV